MLVCKVPTRKWPSHVTSIEEQGIVTDDGPAIEAQHQGHSSPSEHSEADLKKEDNAGVRTNVSGA